jgi:hypothetical protein
VRHWKFCVRRKTRSIDALYGSTVKQVVSNEAQLSWYEGALSADERKQRGHFSTPPALVEKILDACGYTATSDLRTLRLLDPACGSGNFLAGAARRLALSLQAQGLSPKRLAATVQRNIWGLDPDPVACFLAEMQIRSVVEATHEAKPGWVPSLHIHQADSLAFAWQPCVDLLVANPPYLAAKNTDLSSYRLAQQRGQVDSYLLFIDLALQAVVPGGWIGLVLPDPVLARANAQPERARLLRECTLHHIWHLSGVFAADVGAVVLIGQKLEPHSLHRIAWTRGNWRSELVQRQFDLTQPRVGQALLRRQRGAELRYLLHSGEGRAMERLRSALERAQQSPVASRLVCLEDLVSIGRGEEIGRGNASLRPLVELSDGYPILRGGVDLCPYAPPTSNWGIARAAVRKPVERYQRAKLLVVKSTGQLQAALDTRGHVVLQTLYLLHLRDQPQDKLMDTYYFFLALLNSQLLRAYVYHLHTAYKLVQPQIEQAVLGRLPIPWGWSDQQREIVGRAKELERACSTFGPVVEWKENRLAALYAEQEQAVCALYASAIADLFVDKGVVVL